MISEKQEQAAIVQLLETLGGKVWVLGTKRRTGDFQGTMQTPGIPDLYCALPLRSSTRHYRALWIEVKSSQGRASAAQKAFGAVARTTIGTVHLQGTCHDVQNWLVAHGWLSGPPVPVVKPKRQSTPRLPGSR